MIDNTRRSYDAESIKESRKEYFLVIVDHKAKGVCTSFEVAQACAKSYAKKYNAKEIDGDDVYIYRDESGQHLISIEKVKRIRMKYNIDD